MAGTRGTPPRRASAAIRWPWLLRAIAASMTLLTFGSMTYFAAGHVQDPAAPLQPGAPAGMVSAPVPTPTQATRRSFFVSPTVPTTQLFPITRTRQSGG